MSKFGKDVTFKGTRHGEKKYRAFVIQEEVLRCILFRIMKDSRNPIYNKRSTKSDKHLDVFHHHSSNNTDKFDVEETILLLKRLNLFGGGVRQHD